jgi:hypothetical protein
VISHGSKRSLAALTRGRIRKDLLMRKILFTSIVITVGLALGACAEKTPTAPAKAQSTSTPLPASTTTPQASLPSPIPQLTKSPDTGETAPFSLDTIRAYLASQLKLPVEQIKLLGWQAVTWRDSCLGVHTPKQGCLDVLTPGYYLKFQTGSVNSVVNTDAEGKNYRLVKEPESPGPLPALSWTRTGGIAGVCQILSVYSTGAYWLRDCKAGKVVTQGVLDQASLSYVTNLFNQYGSFGWKSIPQAGSADMFIDQIQFSGGGSQVIQADEQQKLDEYLANVTGELIKAGK